jgi:regulator of cell morphogenesis and NO signaling
MEIEPRAQVADLATQFPAAIRVFQSHGIDFCCGGKRPLGEACAETKLDFAELKRDLESAIPGTRPEGPAWPQMPLEEIVAAIVRFEAQLARAVPTGNGR